MDRNEYERRRGGLEELYEADLRLLRAAHESRVRSLEALYLSLDGSAAVFPAQSAALLSAPETAPQPAPEPELPEPAAAPALPPVPDSPAGRPRNPDLRRALEQILPSLPTVFNKQDVIEALGWSPSRSSLYRVLADLTTAGLIKFETYSGGRKQSQFRKV